MARILFVLTGADHWTLADGTEHPTGFWAEEVATPYSVFTQAGHEVAVATPGGAAPRADAASLSADAAGGAENAAALAATLEAVPGLSRPLRLEEVDPADYAAVFYPGGHGPMEDLAVNADSGRLLTAALDSGTPLGVLCHGPAALLAAVRPDGGNAFAGRRVTAFTNAEEAQAGLADRAPWLLQDRLAAAGLDVRPGEPWASHVEVDGAVATGQNPASSAELARRLVELIG